MSKGILFFGSSLNPPTLAHRAMVDQMLKLHPDALIVLAPVYQHIFMNKPALIDYSHRLAMARLAFEDLIREKKLILSEVEKLTFDAMKARQKAGEGVNVGTVDVLHYMKKHPEQFPEGDVHHISLVLGGDAYNDLVGGKWKEPETLLALVDKVYGFDRGAEHRLTLPQGAYKGKIELIQGAISDEKIQAISSTQIRESLAYAESGVVDKKVLAYMKETGCYADQRSK